MLIITIFFNLGNMSNKRGHFTNNVKIYIYNEIYEKM